MELGASQVTLMWNGNVLAPCSLKRCSDVHVAMNLVKVIIKLSFQANFLSFIPRHPPPTLWTFVTKLDGLWILNTQWHVVMCKGLLAFQRVGVGVRRVRDEVRIF